MHPLDAALVHSHAGEFDKAEALLRGLPEDPRALYNLGWFNLRAGNFRQGFEGLTVGRFIEVFGAPQIPGPIWQNQSLRNKTLVLRSEGGLGDEIINFRFHKEFSDRGANVVVMARPELCPLFSSQGVVAVTPGAVGELHYDYWVPAMSAPYVLGHDYSTLDGRPYLRVTPKCIASSQLKVGVRWGGNPTQVDLEPKRKLPVNELLAAVKRPDIELYSFQRDADVLEDFPGVNLAPVLTSWMETAQWMASMDLMITSCTSVAHLAAALGIPTWVFVPVLPYYLWALPGRTSRWYDSVRLFRQSQPDQWATEIKLLGKELEEWVWRGR